MESVRERRLVTRYCNVLFTLMQANGRKEDIPAHDASTRAARFDVEHKARVLGARSGRFELDGQRYATAGPLREADVTTSRGLVVNYVTEQEQRPGSIPDRLHGRYHSPRLRQRLIRVFQHVSRIHLYEAQERFIHLVRLLDKHDSMSASPPMDGADEEERQEVIRICKNALENAEVLLTRNQEDLNFLWREMTQVHAMIIEKVVPNLNLPTQLDFCREEVRRLGLAEDAETKEMIQRLAEAMDEGENEATRPKKVRLLRALIERFNAIRAGRIHEQFVAIRCYRKALLMMTPIAVIMLLIYPLLEPNAPGQETVASMTAHLPVVLRGIMTLLLANAMAFAFFAGLVGGFFSVIIRLRTRELVPGEDAYFTWYVLTKPWVGSLAAGVLFIFLRTGIAEMALPERLLESVAAGKPGEALFAVSFLAGFAERWVFPTLWQG